MRRSSSERRAVRPRTPRSHLALALTLMLAAALVPACAPRADQQATAGGLTVGIRTDPSPAELGENGFLFLLARDGRPVAGADVAFRMFMPGMAMSTDDVWTPAGSTGKGRYAARGEFSMGGTWQVEVRVADGGHTTTVGFPYEIEWTLAR